MQFIKISANLVLKRDMSFYAVAMGRKIGIYDTWSKCEEQIKGYKGAKYKKFPTRSAAESFINGDTGKQQSNNLPVITKKIDEFKDFWPPCDGDEFDDDFLTDEDLLFALNEVEGIPEKKKKFTNPKTANDSKIWEPCGLKHIGTYEFQIDSEGYVIVYTDGSCFNNGQANACAGFGVYFGDDHPLNEGKPVTGRVTNNVGEIQAAIYAIRTAKNLGITRLCLSTDSQFLINSVTMWIKGWKAKNWRLKNGDPVKNIEDFKELDALLIDKKINVKWNYVKAHKGIKGNEMADKLARLGSEAYRENKNRK